MPARQPRSGPSWQVLFAPSIAAMDRLNYARKFIFICVMVSGPLAALGWLQLSNASSHIESNVRERRGVAWIEPANALLLAIQRHRVLDSAVLGGHDSLRAPLEDSVLETQQALERLKQADVLYGTELRTTRGVFDVQQRWERLLHDRPSTAGQSERDHASITARLSELISHDAGNYSSLILDPDLDSYWLVDALLIKLPNLAESVSAVCTAALHPTESERGSVDRTVALASGFRSALVISSELERVNFRIALDATTEPARSREMKLSLEGPMQAVTESVGGQAERIKKDFLHPEGDRARSATERRLIDQTIVALQRIRELHEHVGPELDRIVAAREARYRLQRTLGLVAALAAATLLAYLFIGFYLSVRASLRAVTTDDYVPSSRDELGQIAGAYTRAQGEKTVLRQQLVHADRLATIGKLAAGTAHEINEPLGAILGFAQLALKAPELQDETRQDLTKIEKAALHAREVIKKLMLFARQTPPHMSKVRLNQVVEESFDLLTIRREQQEVTVQRELSAELPEIVADPAHVRQVVVNLVVNAIQASGKGGTVTVRTRAEPSYVVLEVEDQGTGMSDDALKNIFLPFYTTKDIGQGTGLGLSVVHGIVTAHGGKIDVESKQGEGTRFEVRWSRA